jgi:hypothetical protein
LERESGFALGGGSLGSSFARLGPNLLRGQTCEEQRGGGRHAERTGTAAAARLF